MAVYDLGDGVQLRHKVYDSDRELAAATVSLVVTKPDASTIEPDVSTAATGIYDAETITADQAGPWSYVWTVAGSVIDQAHGGFTVADPAPLAYTDVVKVKRALGKTSEDVRDDLIEDAIAAASRMIDERCGRRFYADTTAIRRMFPACDRYYTDGDAQYLRVDDIADPTGMTVEVRRGFGGTWTTVSDWELGPDNAALDGRPYTEIVGAAGWLDDTTKVRALARWGWPAIPDGVTSAAALLAARLYRRKDSPQGVIGSADWGAIRVSRFDPDVETLIAPYILILA